MYVSILLADSLATVCPVHRYSTLSDVKLGSRLVTIQLNVQLGTTLLQDKFVWDHAETSFTPEQVGRALRFVPRRTADSDPRPSQFAERLCSDLGIGGGFIPLVACSIREQLIADKRKALQEDLGEHKPPITILQLSDCYHLVGEAGAEGLHPILTLNPPAATHHDVVVSSNDLFAALNRVVTNAVAAVVVSTGEAIQGRRS